METVTIQKAKASLSKLIERACKGEEIVIARGRKPMVRLVPVPIKQNSGRRQPGAWKGRISWTADAFAPLTDQELKDLGFE
jgi:prevent-host-death family protein